MTLYIILIEILKEFAKNFKCWRIGGGGQNFTTSFQCRHMDCQMDTLLWLVKNCKCNREIQLLGAKEDIWFT